MYSSTSYYNPQTWELYYIVRLPCFRVQSRPLKLVAGCWPAHLGYTLAGAIQPRYPGQSYTPVYLHLCRHYFSFSFSNTKNIFGHVFYPVFNITFNFQQQLIDCVAGACPRACCCIIVIISLGFAIQAADCPRGTPHHRLFLI